MPSARVVGFTAALACTAGCTNPVAGDDSTTEAAPAFIPLQPRSPPARLRSIVASGPTTGPTVYLDIDPPLEWLGVQIACPPERP